MPEPRAIRTSQFGDQGDKSTKRSTRRDGRAVVAFIAIFALLCPSFAQSGQNPSMVPSPQTSASGLILQDGTPVKLRVNRTISSADANTGEEVDFEVLEDLRINGVLVIAKGGTAIGTVTQAEAKKRMARGGKLDISVDSVRLTDTEKADLRAVKQGKGGGPAGAMTAGIVATSLIVWPAAPLFLLMHGKDITIPKGTEMTAYVNGDMSLDPARFRQAAQANGAMAAPPQEGNATLQITSVPAGADIEIDGNFVGNTPSQLGLPAGDHTVRLTKNGFVPWEKKLHSTGGSSAVVAITAEMDHSKF